jgi:hypothetical protein
MKGGLGAKPPARGGTPAPRPKPTDYGYRDGFNKTSGTSQEISRKDYPLTRVCCFLNISSAILQPLQQP